MKLYLRLSRFKIILILCASSIMACTVVLLTLHNLGKPRLPEDHEVIRMTAALIALRPECEPFEVPSARIPEILGVLRPYQEWKPKVSDERFFGMIATVSGEQLWAPIGKLTLECMDGRKVDVHLLYTCEKLGAFQVTDGKRWVTYIGGNDQAIRDVLEKVHKEIEKQKQSPTTSGK